MENQEKPKKNYKNVLKWVCFVVIFLVVSYVCVAFHYKERFFVNTTINGEDCADKTIKVIEGQMQKQVEEYALTITGVDGTAEVIQGVDIDVQYSGVDAIKAEMEKQNPFLWFKALFEPKDIKAELAFSYNKVKADEMISQLACLKEENQIAPVDAKAVYADGSYAIEPEVHGSLINQEQFMQLVHAKFEKMETAIDLEAEGCYVLPKYAKDSAEVIAIVDALNKCLTTEITYTLDGTDVKLDKENIKDWLSHDETMNLVISSEGVSEFVGTLSNTYNTAPRTQHITTPTGKQAYVAGATVGRTIGTSAECERLMGDIQEGLVTTRQPIIAQNATPEGQYAWGNTYTEVDISAQHMWYIVDGQPVFETAVITGNPNLRWGTPAGKFKILEKLSPKTLRGNIDPATGQPEYIQPVDYWARVTWSGVGFHDCTWHQTFGGDIYLRNGSHGCINMPPAAAAEFYGMVYVGCPVIIHY